MQQFHLLNKTLRNIFTKLTHRACNSPSATLTDEISDRETFMKGIDYSYYYEQED